MEAKTAHSVSAQFMKLSALQLQLMFLFHFDHSSRCTSLSVTKDDVLSIKSPLP